MVIKSSSKNKRKGDHDTDLSSFSSYSRSVVFSPRNTSISTISSTIKDDAWTETKSHLNSILELCHSDDKNLLEEIAVTKAMRESTFPANVQTTLDKAADLQRKLQAQISQVNLHLQDESTAVAALQEQLQKILEHSNFLERASQETVTHSQQLENEIDEYKRIIGTEENSKCSVEAQRKLQVPRLQQQISLYASMTGIKWDFEEQEKLQAEQIDTHLVGQVVRTIGSIALYRWLLDGTILDCYRHDHQGFAHSSFSFRAFPQRIRFDASKLIVKNIVALMLPTTCGQ